MSGQEGDGIREDRAEAIKKQIGPGLRSMYASILHEELPDDLLAVVRAMQSRERQAAPKDGAARKEGDGDD
jgi:phosphoglycolate phosphatase-like HAD superfamily hydrolase